MFGARVFLAITIIVGIAVSVICIQRHRSSGDANIGSNIASKTQAHFTDLTHGNPTGKARHNRMLRSLLENRNNDSILLRRRKRTPIEHKPHDSRVKSDLRETIEQEDLLYSNVHPRDDQKRVRTPLPLKHQFVSELSPNTNVNDAMKEFGYASLQSKSHKAPYIFPDGVHVVNFDDASEEMKMKLMNDIYKTINCELPDTANATDGKSGAAVTVDPACTTTTGSTDAESTSASMANGANDSVKTPNNTSGTTTEAGNTTYYTSTTTETPYVPWKVVNLNEFHPYAGPYTSTGFVILAFVATLGVIVSVGFVVSVLFNHFKRCKYGNPELLVNPSEYHAELRHLEP